MRVKKSTYEFSLEWLKIAEDDLKWAKHSFKGNMYSRVCFVSQQVAEKSLKGFLYFEDKRAPKTHKLVDLAKLCRKIDPDFKLINKHISILDPFYLGTRYPDIGDIERFDKKDLAERAIESAEKVLEFVKGKLTESKKSS